MEEKIKEISNQELIQIYRMIIEHLEYLEKEKNNIEEDDKEWLMN